MDLDPKKLKANLNQKLEAAKNVVKESDKKFLMTIRIKREAFIKEQSTINEAKKTFVENLMDDQKFNQYSKFSKCEELFGKEEFYQLIPEADRLEIFTKSMKNLAELEIEENGTERRDRNIRVLRRVFRIMDITHQTTWKEALEMLDQFPRIQKDKKLKKMDMEDKLIVFSEYIEELELTEAMFQLQFNEKVKCRQRKNRERFQNLLEILHKNNYINASTLWKEIVPFLSERVEFIAMLSQPGSTPLDLFKLYVQSLKDIELKVKIKKQEELVEKPKSAYKKKPKILSSWNRITVPVQLKAIKEENVSEENILEEIIKQEIESDGESTEAVKKPLNKIVKLPLDGPKEAKMFECPDCFYKAKRRDHIKRHYMTIHLKEKRFSCELCQRDFSMNAHLKRHRETVHKHINDDGKGWACDCCGVKFESKKTLNFHMKNHWNTKFKCVKCKKIFQRATNLKNHMKLHGETLHEKCEHCEAGFATKNQLKQHLVSQHFTDKLQCQHCSSQFIRKHHYTRHIKTVHKQLDKGVMDALLQKIENIVTDYKELKFIRT